MAEITPLCWYSDRHGLAAALANAGSVQTFANPHIDGLLPSRVVSRPAPALFGPVDRPCSSFSQWWTRATRGMQHLNELPGLVALGSDTPAEPLFA